jgi:hypothetical protein
MLIATTGVLPTLTGTLLPKLIDPVSILWVLKARKDN